MIENHLYRQDILAQYLSKYISFVAPILRLLIDPEFQIDNIN